jgi:hypothetical protein
MSAEEAAAVPKRSWKGSAATLSGGVFVGLVALFVMGQAGMLAASAPPPPAQTGDILDTGSDIVARSTFDILLVQLGTEQPYTGYGLPGINLRVDTPNNILNWTLHGWANETAPQPEPRICGDYGVFYSEHDWQFGSTRDGNWDARFFTVPSTVPQRVGPQGDHCLLRTGATDIWNVTVCIEGPPVGEGDKAGPPRGEYTAADGTGHRDVWDLCLAKPFSVPA